jgi:hypothetical protein
MEELTFEVPTFVGHTPAGRDGDFAEPHVPIVVH